MSQIHVKPVLNNLEIHKGDSDLLMDLEPLDLGREKNLTQNFVDRREIGNSFKTMLIDGNSPSGSLIFNH